MFIRNFMSVFQTSDWQKDPLHPVFDSRTRHQTGQLQNLPHHHRPPENQELVSSVED